jgi:hypothetical protein
MNRGILNCICFVLTMLIAVVASGQSNILPRSDTQNWNDVIISVPVAGPVDFLMQGTIRNGRDLSRPVDERIGVGFLFRAGKYLTLIPNYLHIGMQPFKGRKVFEDRLSFVASVRFPVGRFTFVQRNTFERRFRDPVVDATRYRNRLQIEHPIGPTKKHINIFVNDEVFYDWSFNAWVRNRFGIGVSKTFNKHVSGDLYYMRQNDSHSFPGDLNILGTALRFKL